MPYTIDVNQMGLPYTIDIMATHKGLPYTIDIMATHKGLPYTIDIISIFIVNARDFTTTYQPDFVSHPKSRTKQSRTKQNGL